jgi:hypothetical protein
MKLNVFSAEKGFHPGLWALVFGISLNVVAPSQAGGSKFFGGYGGADHSGTYCPPASRTHYPGIDWDKLVRYIHLVRKEHPPVSYSPLWFKFDHRAPGWGDHRWPGAPTKHSASITWHDTGLGHRFRF